MTQQFAKLVSAVGTVLLGFLLGERHQSYRPEAYYMRGPGPKRREKHLQARDILR
jgi:hypothetical protein